MKHIPARHAALRNVDELKTILKNLRSEKALEALKKLMPPKCNCLRSGHVANLLASELVPGDIIHLSIGDRLPADLRLIDTIDLHIDESSLTGETEAVLKNSNTLDSIPSIPDQSYLNNVHSSSQFTASQQDHQSAAVIPLDRLHGCHDLKNIAFMGTLVCSGKGRGIVIATGHHSEFGEVFKMMQSEEAPRTPLQKSMDLLGQHLSTISLCVIGVIVLFGFLQGRRFWDLLNIGVSLAVAAIPEGLPIVVTVTLAIGQVRMASRQAIVRRLPAVETLGCVNVICADKTGTLTKNEMTIANLVLAQSLDEVITIPSDRSTRSNQQRPPPPPLHKTLTDTNLASFDLPHALPHHVASCSNGLLRASNALASSLLTLSPDARRLIEIGCLCNNAALDDNGLVRGQPTEAALLRLAMEANIPDPRPLFTRVQEWPFNSDTKVMLVSGSYNGSRTPSSLVYFAKGAPDFLLDRCVSTLTAGSGSSATTTRLTPETRQAILARSGELGRAGLRVLALASGTSNSPDQLTFYGLVGMRDPPRVGVDSCIRLLYESGVKVVMITGDSRETACSVGSQLAVFHSNDSCLSGEDVEHMSEVQLKAVVRNVTVFYRSSPRHKCKIVKAFQQNGYIVAMTGDGVNDAIALKSSDIGVAMGRDGTDVCREASDIVLLDDNFSTILSAMEEGKAIFANIRNFVGFQLSTSIAALGLVALSTICSLPSPLNAMQILFINILMDGPPAQSLGVEPPDPDVIRQPPRSCQEPILNRRLLGSVLATSLIIVTGTYWVFLSELDRGSSSSLTVTRRDTTMTFTCFVLFDMFSALTFRSQKKSIFHIGLLTNKTFLAAVGLSLLGQLSVIYFPPLQAVFQTEALAFSETRKAYGNQLLSLINDCLRPIGKMAPHRRRPLAKVDDNMV